MREPTDIDYTDAKAASINYRDPPAELHPNGFKGEDVAWSNLADWFDNQGIPWADAMLVYVSWRFDQPVPLVYAGIDSWMKDEIDRREAVSDPTYVRYGN